jgi:hypothetical protein
LFKIKPDKEPFSVAMSEKDFDENAKAKKISVHLGVQRHKIFEMNEETVSQEF